MRRKLLEIPVVSASIASPSYVPLPVNPRLIEEVRRGVNLLFWWPW